MSFGRNNLDETIWNRTVAGAKKKLPVQGVLGELAGSGLDRLRGISDGANLVSATGSLFVGELADDFDAVFMRHCDPLEWINSPAAEHFEQFRLAGESGLVDVIGQLHSGGDYEVVA